MIDVEDVHALVLHLLAGSVEPADRALAVCPLIHLLLARNWNLAMSLLPLTASSVANNVAVSTPLRMGSSVVVDISLLCRVSRMSARLRGESWPYGARLP